MELENQLNKIIENEEDIVPFLKTLDIKQKRAIKTFVISKKEELFTTGYLRKHLKFMYLKVKIYGIWFI